jgi:c-di-GMP-binding flagellar brake protein YcgR
MDYGKDKRQHRRLAIRLPLEYRLQGEGDEPKVRTVTKNISTGGVYFELDLLDGMKEPEVNHQLNIDLTVPPGDGHSPYQGKISSVAEIVRCRKLDRPSALKKHTHPRLGIAARFSKPLRLSFS